jgi:hypothetical protein
VYYLHQDALGSTRLVTNSAILALFSSNYIPYGIKYATLGKEELMYTGKPYATATGLYYYGARYCDSTISGIHHLNVCHVRAGGLFGAGALVRCPEKCGRAGSNKTARRASPIKEQKIISTYARNLPWAT